MFVSIFVPTGNRAKSIKIVLDSLKKQTYKIFEVIVVDYKSTDNTQEVVKEFSRSLTIHFIQQNNKGLSNAANLALKHAKGEIFIRTDDDVEMSPQWLQAIVDTFTFHKKVGGVTGPTIIPSKYLKNRDLFIYENKFTHGNSIWRLLGTVYYNWFMEGKPFAVGRWFGSGAFSLGSNFKKSTQEPLQEVDNLEACNFAVATRLLKKIGGFDTLYAGVGEYHEADAAYKIKNSGYKLYFNPKAVLFHKPSRDGFFHERPNSYLRMINYVVFYMRFIKLNTFKKILQCTSYIIFLWCYYCLTGIKTKNLKQFGAIPGTLAGFIVYFKNPLTF